MIRIESADISSHNPSDRNGSHCDLAAIANFGRVIKTIDQVQNSSVIGPSNQEFSHMTSTYRIFRNLGFSFIVILAGQDIFAPSSRIVSADDTEQQLSEAEKKEAAARKERYTKWMRNYAETTKLKLIGIEGKEDEFAELVPQPVFRYSDQEHRIPDATMWVWTRNARPVAFQKVEGNDHGGGQKWTICFASLSEGLVNVYWQGGREYAARKPGVTFNPIPDAEAPADNSRIRKVQIKTLKDRFTGRLGVDDLDKGSETRTMPKPLFEYDDPKTMLPIGAVFGMTSTGTNPNLLLVIEARPDSEGKLRWEYATSRMTSGPVRFRLDDKEVWAESAVANAAFDNWTYYFLRREFP